MFRTITFLIVTLLVPLVGCSSREENEKSKLVGKWVMTNYPKEALVFFGDGTGIRQNDDELYPFSWKAENGCLMLSGSTDPASSFLHLYDYELSGATLTLSKGTTNSFTFSSSPSRTARKGGLSMTYQKQ